MLVCNYFFYLENNKKFKIIQQNTFTKSGKYFFTSKTNELLTEDVKTLRQEKLLAEACEGLASTQTVKLQELAEKLDYESDSQYSAKLTTLKEFYFKAGDSIINEKLDDELIEIETIVEEEEIVPQEDRRMTSILNALSRASAIDRASNVNAPAY